MASLRACLVGFMASLRAIYDSFMLSLKGFLGAIWGCFVDDFVVILYVTLSLEN